jgi:TetR/AcrR family transcriptional regulator, lmrAB and yxaGH operons repressor
MPAPTLSRDEVLAILLDTFRSDGYDGASLSRLAEATGLSKSSLYHYFPGGKADMGRQVLELAETWLRETLLRPLSDADAPVSDRLDTMLDRVSAFYEDGGKACILGRLSASVERDVFQEQLARVFLIWIDALAKLLQEGGATRAEARKRAEDTLIRIQGALVLCDALHEQRPFQRVIRSLRTELLSDLPRSRR